MALHSLELSEVNPKRLAVVGAFSAYVQINFIFCVKFSSYVSRFSTYVQTDNRLE